MNETTAIIFKAMMTTVISSRKSDSWGYARGAAAPSFWRTTTTTTTAQQCYGTEYGILKTLGSWKKLKTLIPRNWLMATEQISWTTTLKTMICTGGSMPLETRRWKPRMIWSLHFPISPNSGFWILIYSNRISKSRAQITTLLNKREELTNRYISAMIPRSCWGPMERIHQRR